MISGRDLLSWFAGAALLILLYLAASGCASTPAPVQVAPAIPAAQPLARADCDGPPVATSTPTPDASCSTIREAWRLQRDNAVRWQGLAAKRKVRLAEAEKNLAETRTELAAAHARLVEAPPPAPAEHGSVLLRILLPAGGAALAGGVAALACEGAECSTSGAALAIALSSGVAAGLGAVVAEVLP
jgi:hypothetical protein